MSDLESLGTPAQSLSDLQIGKRDASAAPNSYQYDPVTGQKVTQEVWDKLQWERLFIKLKSKSSLELERLGLSDEYRGILDGVVKKLMPDHWCTCRLCYEDWSRLTEGGICVECQKGAAKPKPVEAIDDVLGRISQI